MDDKPKRVYHPTLNAWQDVPAGDVSEWTDAGWRSTKPKHIDDAEALPVGQGYRPPAVHLSTEPVEPEASSTDAGSKSK